MITINIDKAREIHKNLLRKARQPLLERLDIDYIRAQEQGIDTTDIVSKKQQLRDITNHPDLLSASTVDDLKSFWPDILNG